MRLRRIRVKNFRALADIDSELSPRCNVIVGPNAIGKTTILDAIRLAKGLVAPRTQNEPNQILFALGAMSPHNPGAIDASVLANRVDLPVEISCEMDFSAEEMALLSTPESAVAIATQLVLGSMGRQFSPQTELLGFFSTPAGRVTLETQSHVVQAATAEIRSGTRQSLLAVVCDPKTGQITSPDPLIGSMIGFLDRRLVPGKTIFNCFPADRAIPTQEQPVQIGPGDANSQLESYNSQPQVKYSRLKNTIFNSVVSGRAQEQCEQFNRIFSRILRGRTLVETKVSDRGTLRIDVRDDERGNVFPIDAMSSGEKGLILTCLLIAQTMEQGGIVLLDEPELHLNPAVCKDVLNFLVEEYANPNDLQVIICTHSPEILSVAFDRPDCELHHLVSGTELAPVRRQDLEEVGKALKRLGASQSEGLLYKGSVFVEGEDDGEILQEGFQRIFQRYIFRELGGRQNIEKEVNLLQKQERLGRNPVKTAFILDNDGKPTKLKSSPKVRILQWDRRCLENYLLDFDVLTDIAKDPMESKIPITNTAALKSKLKALAMTQIRGMAFWEIYNRLAADISIRRKDVQGKTVEELATIAADKMSSLSVGFSSVPRESWESSFATSCRQKEEELKQSWQDAWPTLCDGKQLIRDLHQSLGVKDSLPRFKLRIISAMESGASALWLEIEQKLKAITE